MRAVILSLLCGFIVASPVLACSMFTPDHVADASEKRDVICQFVEVWAPNEPKLKRLDELCKAGADLKVIAGAYAGCSAQEHAP